MKLLFDLFPVIFFFATFKYAENHRDQAADFLINGVGLSTVSLKLAPILLATVAVILAATVQIIWSKLKHGRVDKVLWLSFSIVVLLGGLTLAFQNDLFIKWKPTVLYWGLAVGMLFSLLSLRKNSVKALLGEQIELPEPVWFRLNLSVIVFLIGIGLLNIAVAFYNPLCYSIEQCESQWVNFKVFGITGLFFVFLVIQGLLLAKYIEEKK